MKEELVTPRQVRMWLAKNERSFAWLARKLGISTAAPVMWQRRGAVSFRYQIQIAQMMGIYGEIKKTGSSSKK